MKVTRARILAGVAGWLLLLAPLLLQHEGKFAFGGGVVSTGGSALFALGTWRFFSFVRARLRLGRRRSMKTTGKIIDQHIEQVSDSSGGGKLARWLMTVSYPTGTKQRGKIVWAPYDAYTNWQGTLDRVERRNPVGKEVVVHVDPNEPSNASVGVRMSWVIYPGLALGGLALTLSVITFVTLSCMFLLGSFVTLWRWLT